MNQGSSPSHSGVAPALATLALALISTAGAIGLIEPTETRYAEIAREMRASGDWLVPRLDGIAHFHKPPLSYWAAAIGMSVLGTNEWGARVPAALAAILTLVATALAARRRFGGRAGDFAPSVRSDPPSPSRSTPPRDLGASPTLAVWILGTSVLFTVFARSIASDVYLAATVTWFWALAPSSWALAMLGAGFMVKGPVVFVHTALPILLVAALRRDRDALGLLGPRRGWLLFGLIALPWYLATALKTPGLLRYWLFDQIFERYATGVHQRPGPAWYFVAVLIAGMLPWTPALVAGIQRAWRQRQERDTALTFAWLLAPVIFLSFSGSKLPAYLLPCLPAAALIASRGFESRAARRATATALLLLVIAALVFGPRLLGRAAGLSPPGSVALPWPAVLACVCLTWAALSMMRARRERAAVLVTLAWMALVVAVAPHAAALGSPRALVQVLRENRAPGEPVVEIAHFNAALPFYLGERVRLLEVPRETGLEDVAHRAHVVITRDSLLSLAARHDRVWTLGPEPLSDEIARGAGLRYGVLVRSGRDALGFMAR